MNAMLQKNVLWTVLYDGQVSRSSKTSATEQTFAAGQLAPFDVAIAGDDVYWTDHGTIDCVNAPTYYGALMHRRRAGGTIDTLAEAQGCPTAIALDADAIYWATYLSGNVVRLAR